MIVVCQNCWTVYDIPTEEITSSGRDVECTSCGNMWRQSPQLVNFASILSGIVQKSTDQSTNEVYAHSKQIGEDNFEINPCAVSSNQEMTFITEYIESRPELLKMLREEVEIADKSRISTGPDANGVLISYGMDNGPCSDKVDSIQLNPIKSNGGNFSGATRFWKVFSYCLIAFGIASIIISLIYYNSRSIVSAYPRLESTISTITIYVDYFKAMLMCAANTTNDAIEKILAN